MDDGRTFTEVNGQLMFLRDDHSLRFADVFEVKVGAVSGADLIYTHAKGNMEFVYSKTVDTGETRRMLYGHQAPASRQAQGRAACPPRPQIRDESNWWQWGRHFPINELPRIYVNGRTRKPAPFFLHDCHAFDGLDPRAVPEEPENLPARPDRMHDDAQQRSRLATARLHLRRPLHLHSAQPAELPAAGQVLPLSTQGFQMTFIAQLNAAWQKKQLPALRRPRPRSGQVPCPPHRSRDDAIFEFCAAIVDATADLVCSFKPQIAYFAARRPKTKLEALIAHIHEKHPGIPVILDSKRGDIGSTGRAIRRRSLRALPGRCRHGEPLHGPRFGPSPTWPTRKKGVILLCRTSNPGGSDLQFLDVGGEKLYERVARLASSEWNSSGQISLVVGATFPAEIAPRSRNRRRCAAACPRHRRPGRRHRSHRPGRPYRQWHRLDDQFIPCHSLRRQG